MHPAGAIGPSLGRLWYANGVATFMKKSTGLSQTPYFTISASCLLLESSLTSFPNPDDQSDFAEMGGAADYSAPSAPARSSGS